jgi:hypothetical protein
MSLVNAIEASTLIFVGEKDRQLVPEYQGQALYKALKARGINTELHEFPNQGHTLGGIEVERHIFETSIEWIWRHVPSSKYYDDCREDERTTTTTKDPSSSSKPTTTDRPNSSASPNYFLSDAVLAAMQVVTLTVWAQFKFM